MVSPYWLLICAKATYIPSDISTSHMPHYKLMSSFSFFFRKNNMKGMSVFLIIIQAPIIIRVNQTEKEV
jgi:hypothetical protein